MSIVKAKIELTEREHQALSRLVREHTDSKFTLQEKHLIEDIRCKLFDARDVFICEEIHRSLTEVKCVYCQDFKRLPNGKDCPYCVKCKACGGTESVVVNNGPDDIDFERCENCLEVK